MRGHETVLIGTTIALSAVALVGIPIAAALSPITSTESNTMKPFTIAILALVSCDPVVNARTCVQHERAAFDQCMGKSDARANECIVFSKQVFDDCAHEHECAAQQDSPERETETAP